MATHESTIFVKFTSGAYVTNTVHGRRASSTSSALQAAQSLAEKLYGAGLAGVAEVEEGCHYVRRFSARGSDLVRVGPATGRRMVPAAPGATVTGDGTGTKLPPVMTAAQALRAGKASLQAAGYWTGASSANGQPRCDNCAFVQPHGKLYGATKHDRSCTLNLAAVKTHGCCKRHQRQRKA